MKHIAEILELPTPKHLGTDSSEKIARYEREQLAQMRRIWMDRAGLPRRIKRLLENERTLRMDIIPMIEIPRAIEKGTLLAVFGAPGTGKSIAACYTMMLQLKGKYLRADRYADLIRSTMLYSETGRYAMAYVRSVQTTAILTLDDCGEENDRDVSKIASLIEERYDGDLSTILTTNLTPDQFVARYGKRVRSRLGEVGEVVICKEVVRPSRRGK